MMIPKKPLVYALLAAALFGAATPASKILLSGLTSFQLAGLLYLGAAVGVAPAAVRKGRIRFPAPADRRNRRLLLGAAITGGICGPVLLLIGLRLAEASSVSLWLNLELAATALLGVLFFQDHLDLAGWLGVALTFAGAVALSLGAGSAGLAAGALVLLACVLWGLDNHFTALIDGITPAESTFWKGLVAGAVNFGIGMAVGGGTPALSMAAAALVLGAFAYGASIALYITSAHALGTTRAQIAFSTAPFFGLILSAVFLGELLTVVHLVAALLFLAAVGLLGFERHSHPHEHELMEHEHEHGHSDAHHEHDVDMPHSPLHGDRHAHRAVTHDHPHLPDLHHRHKHP